MTGVAGHLSVTLKIFLVNGEHHLHHLPRHLFRLLIILLECALHVAETAFHS